MSEVLGVALLGAAHTPHAMSYARCFANDPATTLVGVYDSDAELGARVAERFGTTHHTDLGELLDRDGLDAVVVCSATAEHRALVEAAASSGLHVLCEKPIATTVEDAVAMIDTCERHGVQLHVAFVCRFYPVVARVRDLIESGAIGDVIGMVGGNRGRPPLPPQYPSWITDTALAGGGSLIDHSVHVVDAMRHVTGREVTRVHAEVDDRFWQSGVDDMAALTIEFGGGAVASVDPSWSVPAGHPWSYDFFLRVVGTAGAISIDDTPEALRVSIAGEGMRLVPFGVDIDAEMCAAFAASITAGELQRPCADGVDGLRALEVALAGYESAATGTTVALGADRSR